MSTPFEASTHWGGGTLRMGDTVQVGYVDQAREPEGNKDFRVFRGQKGAVKPQKMVNIVSDSEGEIFITKAGKLRFVLNKSEKTWVEGKKETKLIDLPIDDNHVLIYTDLGVYTGQRLGTPCDDF